MKAFVPDFFGLANNSFGDASSTILLSVKKTILSAEALAKPISRETTTIAVLNNIVLYIIYIDALEIANPEQKQDVKHG
jgi:hypothetical protein